MKSGHELETRNATIAKLRNQLTKGGLSKEERQNLERQIRELTNAAATFNKNVKERNATIAKLRNQLNRGELSSKEKTELMKQIKQLEEGAVVSEEQLETLRGEQTEFKKQLNQSATELATAREERQKAIESKAAAIREAEQAAANREQQILKKTNAEIKEAQKEAKAAQNKANEANASVKAAQAKATQNMNALRTETTGKVTAAQQKVANLQRQLNERPPANEANKLKKEIKNAKEAANAIKIKAKQNLANAQAKARNEINAEKARAIAAEKAQEKAELSVLAARNGAALARQEQKEAKERLKAITEEFNKYKAKSNKVTQERKEKLNLLTKKLETKNKILTKTTESMIKLRRNLNSSKVSSAKKNQILQKLESETKILETQMNEVARGQRELTQQRNALNQELKAAKLGRFALERKLKNLQAAKTISNNEKTALQKKLAATQNNLRRTATNLNHTRLQMQGRISGMTQGQKRIQTQLNQARQSARNYKAAARRNVGPQFNATGAFQNMGNKLAANRNAWKRAGGRWQGAQSGVKAQENLKAAKNALYTIINSHRKNGNWTIGGPVGWKRQTLRHKVNTATNMNQIKEARRLVAAAKKEKNFKIGRGKINPILDKVGTGFSFGNRGPPMTMNQRFA